MARDEFDSLIDAPLLDRIHAATRAGVEATNARKLDGAEGALNDLLEVAARTIAGNRDGVVVVAARALATIYATPEATFELKMRAATGLYALGGLAVRLEKWSLVTTVALLPSGNRHEQPFLLPDAHLQEARHRPPNNIGDALIKRAADWADGYPSARPELPAGDTRILNSTCQFNAAASLVQARVGERLFWPEFRRFESRRCEPFFEDLIVRGALRSNLLPGLDDPSLAALLMEVGGSYRNVYELSVWGGYEKPVSEFVRDNLPADNN